MSGAADALDHLRRAYRELGDLADRVGPTADGDDRGMLERLEHLVDQTVLWLGWAVLHADPDRPFFHRHNDLVSQWGGPNADNVYRHARIDPTKRYVVRGRMHSCDEFLLAVRAGFMHRPTWGTLAQLSANDLGIGPGDDFELHFGGDHPDAILLPEGTVMISIREYYFDWVAEEPATITIECLDPSPAAPLTDDRFGQRLDEALAEITDSIDYWADYLDQNRAERIDNTFTADTVALSKGLAVARYEFCFWDLQPEQALLIETDMPDARYWSMQLYTMHSFEPVDPYGAITSRNHRQSTTSNDGRIRYVLSGTDPGVPNWLDIGDRANGLCTFRWFWPHSEARPNLTTQLIPVNEVSLALPADTGEVSAAARAEELAARQAHLRWRFRS